jgi:hypothetical protein
MRSAAKWVEQSLGYWYLSKMEWFSLRPQHYNKPDGCLPFKKNHIEQNFFITSRYERWKSTLCNVTAHFASFNF